MAWKTSYKQTPDWLKDDFLNKLIEERKEAIASTETRNHALMKRELEELEQEQINRKQKRI
jgi:hypothetical protein